MRGFQTSLTPAEQDLYEALTENGGGKWAHRHAKYVIQNDRKYAANQTRREPDRARGRGLEAGS